MKERKEMVRAVELRALEAAAYICMSRSFLATARNKGVNKTQGRIPKTAKQTKPHR